MQAIETKYIGPTSTRGSRIKAKAFAGSITVAYDHSLTLDGNHRAAAVALNAKFDWVEYGDLVDAQLPNGSHVWVSVSLSSLAMNKLQRILDYLREDLRVLGAAYSHGNDAAFTEVQNTARAVKIVEDAYQSA